MEQLGCSTLKNSIKENKMIELSYLDLIGIIMFSFISGLILEFVSPTQTKKMLDKGKK